MKLTPRQRAILDLRCRCGLPQKAIARELGISPQTVKNHVTDIFDRLGERSFDRICYQYGQEAGVIDVPAVRAHQV